MNIVGDVFGKLGVLCPECGYNFCHLGAVQYGISDGLCKIIRQIAITPDGKTWDRECDVRYDYRGNEISIRIDGECGHEWLIIFSEHKGNVYLRTEIISKPDPSKTHKEKYLEYLNSPEWKDLSAQKRQEAGNKCQVCNDGEVTLHVHHRTYDNIFHEGLGDLIVLCENCHKTFHKKEEEL